MVDHDIIVKLATLLLGVVALWKVIPEIIRGRHGDLREEYKFAKDFFADVKQNSHMYPFVNQKGYQAIAGDARITSAEVDYLLTFPNSVLTIKDYVFSRKCLECLVTDAGPQLVFRDGFKSRFSRFLGKIFHFMFYIVCCLFGVVPLILFAFHLVPLERALVAFFFTGLLFIPMGCYFLMEGMRIGRAEMLIKANDRLVK